MVCDKLVCVWASCLCVCDNVVCHKVVRKRVYYKVVCVWQSCVWASCVCVTKLVWQSYVWQSCVCVTKLCVTKLCVWESCVWQSCVCGNVVLDEVVCVCDEVVCVTKLCVCAIWIDVKLLIIAGGRWGTLQSAANEDAAMFLWKRTCIIYICIVPPLGAFKSQLGGTYILPLLFYTVNLYCDCVYIYIYLYLFIYLGHFIVLIVGVLHVWCIPQQNSRRSSEQVCERVCYKVVCDKVVTRGGRGGCGGGGAGYRIKNKNPTQRYGEKQILRVYTVYICICQNVEKDQEKILWITWMSRVTVSSSHLDRIFAFPRRWTRPWGPSKDLKDLVI